MITGKFADYEGGRIYYTDSGKGDVIVLVHGYLETSEVWGRFGDSLSEHNRVIAVDLPGNGRSSLFNQEHTMCFHAGSILSVLDQEKIARPLIVGHSLGGYVTLSLVENHSDRIKGYALLHSHPFADTDEIIENRLREIRVVKSGKKEAIYPVNIPKMFADINLEKFSGDIEELKKIASSHKDEAIISVIKGMINRNARIHILEKGEVPLLLILGKLDNYIPYKMVVDNIRMPQNGRLVTLNNSGHMGFLEESRQVIDEIRQFELSI